MNNMIATTTRALTFCVAAALGFSTSNASAADAATFQSTKDGRLTYVVRFADINLETAAGAQALYSRLRHAATMVCVPLEGVSLRDATQHRECMEKAMADAVASVDRPMLSQYHQSRTKSGDKSGYVQVAKAN